MKIENETSIISSISVNRLKYSFILILCVSLIVSGRESQDKVASKTYYGLALGLPELAGYCWEKARRIDIDYMPLSIVSLEAGLTLGPYCVLKYERRLWSSNYYAEIGYNFWYMALYAMNDEVEKAPGGRAEGHFLQLSLDYRTEYVKNIIYSYAFGTLITSDFTKHPQFYLIPMVSLGIIFKKD
jgi:hypothetical protein